MLPFPSPDDPRPSWLKNVGEWFPVAIPNWIKTQSSRLGVPAQYLDVPLLVSVAYLLQQVSVQYQIMVVDADEEGNEPEYVDFHTEHLICMV